MSEKTEDPTPRRLKRARSEGDSPVSAALTQALSFVVALTLLPGAVAASFAHTKSLLLKALAQPVADFRASIAIREVLLLTLPMLLAAAAAAVFVGFVQTGGVLSAKKLAPDLGRANPIEGLKNLFRLERAAGILRALLGSLLVGWLATKIILDHLELFASGTGNLMGSGALAFSLSRTLLWLAASVGLGLAVIDVLVTRRGWFKRLRMTRDEVKREHREAEGDPQMKADRARAHREVLAGHALLAVRDATVVIVNPTHLATALRYDEDRDQAPLVVSRGAGDLARRIIDAARAYGVPVIRDIPIARALFELEVGEEIPEALYEAVAEVLRTIWEEERPEHSSEQSAVAED